VALVRGVRSLGSLDTAEPGVREETDLCDRGVRFEYGLGVVRVKGLKLWPVSMPDALVDVFQRGLWSRLDTDRGVPRACVGVVVDEPIVVGRREGVSLRPELMEEGTDDCLRYEGGVRVCKLAGRVLRCFAEP
jgi:hypothetical protein